MTGETFWNNQEAAQKVINETNDIRNKLEPLTRFGKQVEDLQVMLELAAEEPEAMQLKLEKEMEADAKKLFADLDTFELKTFLNGPHDKCNCIFTINSGAGGTESQDWAEMLSRMYGRWFDLRGWKWDVTDALQGDTAGLDRHLPRRGRKCLWILQSGTRCSSLGSHLAIRFQQTSPHEFFQRGHRGGIERPR